MEGGRGGEGRDLLVEDVAVGEHGVPEAAGLLPVAEVDHPLQHVVGVPDPTPRPPWEGGGEMAVGNGKWGQANLHQANKLP